MSNIGNRQYASWSNFWSGAQMFILSDKPGYKHDSFCQFIPIPLRKT